MAESGRHRLVDMGASPPTFYEGPPRTAPPMELLIDLDEGNMLFVRQEYVGTRIVWFVLEHTLVEPGSADCAVIARIDCCRGVIHEHRYNRAGDDILDHRPIAEIATNDDGRNVDAVYEWCYQSMMARWELNLDLWRRS